VEAGRGKKAAYLGSWPELVSLEESASVPPTSTSQWIISVNGLFLCEAYCLSTFKKWDSGSWRAC